MSGADFMALIGNDPDDKALMHFIDEHSRPFDHFGTCLVCDDLDEMWQGQSSQFRFVLSWIANSSSATQDVQTAALNAALNQSEAQVTQEVVHALAQNPRATASTLQSCFDISPFIDVMKIIFNHPNVSDQIRELILDEVDDPVQLREQ